MKTCTRCENTGFLNLHQIPEDSITTMGEDLVNEVPKWMAAQTEPHDVQICDCCGNGEIWHGTPGEHYGKEDPPGRRGPYDYNGGLCECH